MFLTKLINIYPHKANQFAIANSFIGLINRRRTIRSTTVAETRIAAAIVVPALVSETEITLDGTARTLKRGKANRAVEITSCRACSAPYNHIMHIGE